MYGSDFSSTGERNEWARSAAGTYTPFGGARAHGILGAIRYWITQLYPDTFPWDRIGAEYAHARPALWGTRYKCRVSERAWKGYEC